jgi:hypothetical protein
MYGTKTVKPISFPDVLEERFYIRDRKTNEQIRGLNSKTGEEGTWNITLEPHRSWDWIKENHSISEIEQLKCLESLQAGIEYPLFTGITIMTVPDDFEISEDLRPGIDE